MVKYSVLFEVRTGVMLFRRISLLGLQPTVLPCPLTNAFLPIQPTFTRRTNGNCMGTFIPEKLFSVPLVLSPAATPLTFPYLLFGCKRMRTAACADADTYGSGVWYGEDVCLTYCVLWNTRNARLAKKSRAVSRPAAGRRVNPVCSETEQRSTFKIQS
jgi:hypothetical protein